MFIYQLYNLEVHSDIELPILTPIEKSENCTLKICLGETPEKLEGDDVVVGVKNTSRPGEYPS